jgi:hypothetical protein
VTCSVFNAFWQDRRYLPSLLQQELALAGRLGKERSRRLSLACGDAAGGGAAAGCHWRAIRDDGK